MRVLFAPDYRAGVPYQSLLERSLLELGVTVEYLSGLKRGFPLIRYRPNQPIDLLHLHWPEYYFRRLGPLDLLRHLRYRFDLKGRLGGGQIPMVYTAHDLLPHNSHHPFLAGCNFKWTIRTSSVLTVHSIGAQLALEREYGVQHPRTYVIPHGDLSDGFGPLIEQQMARRQLGVGTEPVCLMFGNVEPYKGIEEVIEAWSRLRPQATLAIVGSPISEKYSLQIRASAGRGDGVILDLKRQSDDELRLWLSACTCVLFNYRKILTSGSASLARSLGVPILLPKRLSTIELGEPHFSVFRFERFDGSFCSSIEHAAALRTDYASASNWRAETSWNNIAEKMVAAYREAIRYA